MGKDNLIVLCNAKSLADYPFYNYNVDTIGMNIAYRFWHQIGWYPTYYISVDQAVNLNYAKDLYFLVLNRQQFGIKKFLFRKIILKKYPALKKFPEVYFLEDLTKSNKRGVAGVTHVTTGSFAIRWAISMKYKNIYILGVDGYVPLKNPYSLIDPKTRLLKETISPNLNKFFDGYERKGDPLHISNKKNKERNQSHAQTYKSIKKYLKKYKVPTKIAVASTSSKLLLDIFPYKAIPEDFLKPLDQQITFNIIEVNHSILSDKPPKIQPAIEMDRIPKPNKVKVSKLLSKSNVLSRRRYLR